ncbi:DUF2059 domain-containing protein [Algicola sagamiensis]|uniref:DUF2059 domain-containing protein n=1 Tax=Algicola sagamiensis TaxID=163869 RepID=UPI00036FD382|nr:DUF2059 domain-containing protein [Algicola sagamiensis]
MKKAFLFLFIQLLIIQPAFATPSNSEERQLIEELLLIMNLDKYYDEIIDQSLSMANEQISKDLDKKELSENILIIHEKYHEKQRVEILNAFAWEKVKEPLIDMYLELFNKEDIQGLIRFYQSDLGKKAMSTLPEISRKTSLLMQKQSSELMPILRTLNIQKHDEIEAAISQEIKQKQ